MLRWTDKQKEYLQNANSLYNFKVGAVRSGKTYQDTEHIIPYRIRQMAGLEGLVVLLGVTEATIERNLLRPMREKFGDLLVGRIGKNKVKLFGEECYALGAEKVSQVSKVQGMSIKYCYGDEIAKWHKDVFEMLKSRLDQEYSMLEATCNPEYPKHWLKEFIDSDNDIYTQHYRLEDNIFLPDRVIENIKRSYAGTVYYGRYVEGKWINAEGIIYGKFANNTEDFIKDYEDELLKKMIIINIGVDFGGNKSATAFVCSGFTRGFKDVIVLENERIEGIISPDELESRFVEFAKRCIKKWGERTITVYCDSAEQTLIRGLSNVSKRERLNVLIRNAIKGVINERIVLVNKLIGEGRFWVLRHNDIVIEALQDALWDSKSLVDKRLDDGTTNIDTLDALEYSIERYASNLLNFRGA